MANLADLAISVTADPSGVTSGMDEAASSVEGFESTTSRVSSFVEDNFMAISAAGVAAGGALEGFARGQADTNAVIGRMASRTGEADSAIRGMLDGMTDHTFATADAAAGMEALSQRGVETMDDYEKLLPVFDSFADATGKDMVDGIGEATRVLGAFGIPADEAADHIDTLTMLSADMGVDLSMLGRRMARVDDEMSALNLGLDDGTAGVKAFMDQGLSGRDATRAWTDAVKEADGDMGSLLDQLGLTADEFGVYQDEVAGAAGRTDELAGINNGTMTSMEKMQANVDNLMTKYGGLADVASTLAMPLMALGPVAKGVSMGMKGITTGIPKLVAGIGTLVGAIGTKIAAMTSWAATTVAQGAKALGSMAITAGQFIAHYTRMAVASLAQAARMAASWVIAMGPVGWVIAAVVGLVALVVANWDTVKEWTKKIWDWVGDKIEAVWTWVTDTTTKAVDAVVGFVGDLRDKATDIIQAIVDFVEKYHPIMILWRLAKEWVPKAISWFVDLKDKALAKVTDLRDRVVDTVKNLWDKVVGFFGDLKDDAVSIVKGMVKTYVKFVVNLRDDVVGFVPDLKDKVVSFFGGLKDSAVEKVTVLKDKVSGFFGDVRDTAVRIASDLKDKVTSFFGGLKNAAVEQVEALMDRVKGIKDDVLGFFSGAATWLRDAGRNIIQGIIDGIGDKIAAVGNKMNQVASTVRDKLPFSPAKEGPLSGRGSPDIAGAKLVEMVADGMGGQLGTLSRMADAAARAAMPSLAAGSAGGPVIPNTAKMGRDGASAGGVVVHVHGNLDNVTLAEVKREIGGAFNEFGRSVRVHSRIR